jgi:hypothetical protein
MRHELRRNAVTGIAALVAPLVAPVALLFLVVAGLFWAVARWV